METPRRYSEEEIAKILEQATEIQATSGRSLTHPEQHGITLQELQEVGDEVGISRELIAQAAAALDRPTPVVAPTQTFMGVPIGVGRTVELGRNLTDKEWARLVVDLRETFNARGKLRDEGAFRQWTNGNLQALLEPSGDGGQRLRMSTVKGDGRPSLGLGAVLMGTGVALSGAISVLQTGADPGAVAAFLLISVAGAAMHGLQRFTLPRWAETRTEQMEGVAARLLAATNAESKKLGDGA